MITIPTGDCKEIYTLQELKERVAVSSRMLPHWKKQWLQGVMIKYNEQNLRTDVYYYGVLAYSIADQKKLLPRKRGSSSN